MIRAEWRGLAVSDNDRLVPGKARWFPNKLYKAFKTSMAEALVAQVRERDLLNPVTLDLTVSLPPRMDTQAVVKACCDALELAQVIRSDRQIHRVTVTRSGEALQKVSTIVFELSDFTWTPAF